MSTISATGPGGVTKRYGPLDTGGVAGSVRSNDTEVEVVFQTKVGENAGSNLASISLPPYSRIIGVNTIISEAYAASSTVDVKLDGTTAVVSGTPIVLTALGHLVTAPHATAANVTVGATAEDLTIVLNANALASATGEAKVVVQYVRA